MHLFSCLHQVGNVLPMLCMDAVKGDTYERTFVQIVILYFNVIWLYHGYVVKIPEFLLSVL